MPSLGTIQQGNYGGIQWFGGPNAPRNQTARPPRPWQGYTGGYRPAYMNTAGLTQPQGRTAPTQAPTTSTPIGSSFKSDALSRTSTELSGGTPQTGGGYQAPTAPGGQPSALEDLLRGRIRRIRTLGAGERRDITDAGLERGLGRSQESMMERQRQREMEGITGAERDFLAGEFESQRQAAGDERRFGLEREKMQQEMTLSRQRADLERELAQRRFAQEAEQNELERQASIDRAAMSGGGGEGTRIGYGNEFQRATGGGGFGGFSDPSSALERQRQQQLDAQQEAINSRYRRPVLPMPSQAIAR